MDGHPVVERLALGEFSDLPQWQRVQAHFATVLGIALRTLSPQRHLLTEASWPSGVDADRTIRLLKIGEELDQLVPLDDLPQEISQLTTLLGVTYAAVPIRATPTQLVAYFVLGPVVVGLREQQEAFRSRMKAVGIDPDPLWSVLLSMKQYTFTGLRSVLTLLEEVGNAMAQLAYQTKHLEAIIPDATKINQALRTYYVNRLFQSLLETATTATKAEGGSILVYDSNLEAFRINAAQGLSEDVVNTTRVKRGEGIAGLVAQEPRILLIDETVNDPRLRACLRRPDLTSSLVAPLMAESVAEPIGVLNLRTRDPSKRFTEEHVLLLQKLLELAGIALGSLQVSRRGRPAS